MEKLTASIALAAYVEPLLDGRRAVVFGDATSGLGQHLVDRGARVVHVYDPDPIRAAEAATTNGSRNVSVAALGEADVAVRDGAFDVAIVECLTDEDTQELLRRVKRALSPRGVALVASPNAEVRQCLLGPAPERRHALGYYDLYDAVAEHFEEVRMLGQTPFIGYAVVDFAPEDEPEITVDTGFIADRGEEPEWFLALAAARPTDLDPFSVIQLPTKQVLGNRAAPPARDHASEELRSALEQARAQVKDLERERSALQAEIQRAKPDAMAANERIQKLETDNAKLRRRQENTAQASRLETELSQLREKLTERESQATEREQRLAAAEQRAEKARVELERHQAQHAALTQQLTESRDVAAKRSQQLAEAEAASAGLRSQLEERTKRLEALTAAATEESDEELQALESALAERGQTIRTLESQLRAAETVGKELVRELGAPRAAPDEGSGNTAASAELEADLQAARWTIDELEGRLTRQERADSERETLNNALRQARAELQRQATLIEQIRSKTREETRAR